MTQDQQDLDLSEDELSRVSSLYERILQDQELSEYINEQMVVQALMARKFEEPRAFELLTNSVKWRKEHGIKLFLPLSEEIATELKTEKVVIPPLSRDKEGSQVVYYKPGLSKQYPVSPQTFCLSAYYLLQLSIRDQLTQRRGFLFICDLRGTKLSQVDRKLVRAILGMLSNKFPARLKKVLLLEPPSFFNFAFRILRPVIPSKYLEKIATAKLDDLPGYIDTDRLLVDFGGTLQFDPGEYIDSLFRQQQEEENEEDVKEGNNNDLIKRENESTLISGRYDIGMAAP